MGSTHAEFGIPNSVKFQDIEQSSEIGLFNFRISG